MLAFSRARTIAITAGSRGAGATSCTVNLASALARQGLRVLVIDENFDENIACALGVRTRYDLKDVISGACRLEDALVQAPGGLTVLAAAAAVRAMHGLDREAQERAIKCFTKLDDLADLVLLDARNDARELSPFAGAAQEVIVVVSPGSASITGAYAAVKNMSRTHGRKRFRVLVNRAQDGPMTRLLEGNMQQAARKHLDVALEFMGAVPLDPAVIVSARRFSAAVEAAPTAAASRQFCEHAALMLRWSAPQDDVSRLDTFMQRAIYGSRSLAAAGV
ncbi:MAG TPA: AAA family ATPase [Burkholderiales bacterium]|nr:AAA family ATPase [Burkholderiales bacterium]